MRSISIKMRNIVSNLSVLLLLLLDIGVTELDEFLIISVHPKVVLATIFVVNSTLDMWSSCIQEDTPCIFYFFIPLRFNLLLCWLRGNMSYGSFLLKLLHHNVTIVLRRMRNQVVSLLV
jgi:hypothetical protein